MGVHGHRRHPVRVKILSTVHCIGIDPGVQAEIELTETAAALIRAGYLQLLRPSDGQNLPQ